MRHILAFFICLTAGALIYPGPGISDMAPVVRLARGGTVSLKSPHPTVRMDSEQVIIRLEKQTYMVDAVFHLFNAGETTTEWVGFPKQGHETTKSASGSPAESEFTRFDTWVDGTKIKVEEDRDPAPDIEPGILDRMLSAFHRVLFAPGLSTLPPTRERWLVHHVTFPGHARTTIRTSYEAHYSVFHALTKARYIVGTGRLWKGSIGRAVFIIDSSGVGGTKEIKVNFPVASGPRLIGDNLMRFEIENAEPGPNASLTIEVGDI